MGLYFTRFGNVFRDENKGIEGQEERKQNKTQKTPPPPQRKTKAFRLAPASLQINLRVPQTHFLLLVEEGPEKFSD